MNLYQGKINDRLAVDLSNHIQGKPSHKNSTNCSQGEKHMAKAKEVRRQLLKEIDELSEDRVRLLADFAAFLKEREEWVATLEVLENKELAEAVRKSRAEWSQGRSSEFINFSELKQSY